MPANTLARIALQEEERTVRMPNGRHKATWLKCAKEQLEKLNITWQNAKVLAQGRIYWKSLTKKLRIKIKKHVLVDTTQCIALNVNYCYMY